MEGSQLEKLKVWQDAKSLVPEIYRVSASFPREELFGITSQTRRAACSISANIAEGCGRYGFKDKANFMTNARGSLYEVQSFLSVALDLGYLNKEKYEALMERLEKLLVSLNSFIKYLRNRNRNIGQLF